jgi:hypothetical protein
MRSLDRLTDRPSLLLCHGLDWEVFIYFVHCAGETYRPMQTTCDEGCITHGQEAIIYGDKDGIKLNPKKSHVRYAYGCLASSSYSSVGRSRTRVTAMPITGEASSDGKVRSRRIGLIMAG